MTNKIIWLTSDYFIDVDFALVPFLQKSYNIEWYIIKGKNSTITVPSELKCSIFQRKYASSKDPRSYWEMWSFIKKISKEKTSIVYSDTVGDIFYHKLLLHYFKRTPIIHAAHNVKPYSNSYADAWPKRLKKVVAYAFIHHKYFQLFSKATYEYFINHYPNKKVFYCPMTLKSYGKLRTHNYNIDKSKMNLLFFGNIMGNKRLDLLIEAIKSLPKPIKDKIHLTIAGKCNSPETYIKMIGNEKCISTFFKRIDDDEIPELFTKHQFLMLPYEAVAQSGPHMIAYYYDLPVIASRIDGFKDRIEEGINGYCFTVNDKADLCRVITKVAMMQEKEYLVMKSNLHKYAKDNFGIEAIAPKYITFFKSLTNE
mgnify:FL=1